MVPIIAAINPDNEIHETANIEKPHPLTAESQPRDIGKTEFLLTNNLRTSALPSRDSNHQPTSPPPNEPRYWQNAMSVDQQTTGLCADPSDLDFPSNTPFFVSFRAFSWPFIVSPICFVCLHSNFTQRNCQNGPLDAQLNHRHERFQSPYPHRPQRDIGKTASLLTNTRSLTL